MGAAVRAGAGAFAEAKPPLLLTAQGHQPLGHRQLATPRRYMQGIPAVDGLLEEPAGDRARVGMGLEERATGLLEGCSCVGRQAAAHAAPASL